jgi:hypothetical protein
MSGGQAEGELMTGEKVLNAVGNVWLGIGAFIAFCVLVLPVGMIMALYNLGKSVSEAQEKR